MAVHAEIPPPEKFSFAATGDNGGMPVISPQGDKIAFVAHSDSGQVLWVRSLENDTAQPYEGTQGAMHPFWSADERYVGFFAGGKLNKVAVSGGAVTVIADAPNARGGTWNADDVILYSPEFRDVLYKVGAQGGTPAPVTVMQKDVHTTHRWPWFLPDGKHFLYLATSHVAGDAARDGIYFGSLDSRETHLVVATDSAAQYANGYLLFRANTSLMAQKFDLQSGTLSGTAIPLVSNIRNDAGVWRSIFSVSQNGTIVYQAGTAATAGTRLVWFDRNGKQLGAIGERENTLTDVRLSPDGKRVVFVRGNPAPGIWTLDLERNTKARITFDQGAVLQPSWSPDGKNLVFVAAAQSGGGTMEIRTKASDGSGEEKTISTVIHSYHYPAWSPDGKYLTYIWGDGEKRMSLWILPASGEGKATPIVVPPSEQSNILSYRISPDGHWVVYISDESGKPSVYITSFPEGKGKWPVPTDGASYPLWSGNSKELFFKNLNDDVFVCSVTAKADDLQIGPPRRLFHASMPGLGLPYDVSPDGQRLLVNLAEEEVPEPLFIVFNWPVELKK